MRVTDPASPILNSPNRIGPDDWNGWVQERTLYMPRTHDEHYRTMLSMNDTGEAPNDGAILVAPLGKGTYVYTTLALFRQLPAGVPGGARIFANLLSADQRSAGTPSAPSEAVMERTARRWLPRRCCSPSRHRAAAIHVRRSSFTRPTARSCCSTTSRHSSKAHPDVDVQWVDMGSQDVLDRLRSERTNPQADVWFGAPAETFARAANEGLLEAYRPSWASRHA